MFCHWVKTLNFWHVVRLNQVNLPYAIICYLDLLLQGQVIYNLKRKYSTSRHASLGTPSSPPIQLTV